MQQTHQLDLLEKTALQHIAQVLQAPLTALVAWQSGHTTGHVTTPVVANDRFALSDVAIPIYSDSLIRWVMETDGLLPLAIEDVPPETRKWLTGSGIGQLVGIALRTAPDHEPTGIVIVADGPERRWSERQLTALKTLVSQLAWSRRYLSLTQTLSKQREGLERLNWYKHRRLEDLHRSLTSNIKRLSELGNPKDPLFSTRQQQLVRQLQDAIAPIGRMVQEEQWHLQVYPQTISLISLLKRSLGRVDWLIKQRQLWSQVHDETNLTISGDIAKFELVLYELLFVACERSEAGGRIDVWCRQIDSRWLELSITDNGPIDPRLITDLEAGRGGDLLAPSQLNQPPGLHLLVCQSLMKQLGGEYSLYKLEDDRTLSRLVLPLAPTSRPTSPPNTA